MEFTNKDIMLDPALSSPEDRVDFFSSISRGRFDVERRDRPDLEERSAQVHRSLAPLEEVLLDADSSSREVIVETIFVEVSDNINRAVKPIVREAIAVTIARS